MRISLYLSILLLFNFSLSAQTLKPKVLVIGGGAGGTGAAIQAAHSGVETLLLEESAQLGTDLSIADTAGAIGLQADFLKHLKASGGRATPQVILKGWTDTVKNLSVLLNSSIRTLKKSGKGWKIRLADGKKIRTGVLIDASNNLTTAAKLQAEKNGASFKTIRPFRALPAERFYENTLYRTAALADNLNSKSAAIPIMAFVSSNVENLLLIQQPHRNLSGGQIAGASAAFCAFFKTTTKNLNIRVIQGELLAYRSALVPFGDIHPLDSNFTAIQHVGATGILKGKAAGQELYFLPDSNVYLDEIKPAMKEYYTRSQIWFADKKSVALTLNDVLSLIKYSGSRGEELNREVEKAWTASFRFKNKFNLNRPVTRREFAVLLDTYLKPFHVQVNQEGKLLY